MNTHDSIRGLKIYMIHIFGKAPCGSMNMFLIIKSETKFQDWI